MENYYSSITVKNKLRRCFLSLFALLVFGLNSCNVIFEEDISGETVEIVIPTNNDTIFSNNVQFKWKPINGASFYNLQIVKPSFDDIETFILDSNVIGDEFFQILEPGDYAYTITAENSGYRSLTTESITFYVDSVANLESQFVSLVSPVNEIFINGESNINLSWQNLFAADRYEYVLRIGETFETGSSLDQDLNVNTLSYTIESTNFASEGTYFWGIRGVNLTSSSTFSSRQINVDKTRPNNPVITSPMDGVTLPITDAVVLKWTTGTDPGVVNSPVFSTVEIAMTETFDSFVEFAGITSDSLVYTFPSVGNYWWRVKTDDAVGNASEFYSEERMIIIE